MFECHWFDSNRPLSEKKCHYLDDLHLSLDNFPRF